MNNRYEAVGLGGSNPPRSSHKPLVSQKWLNKRIPSLFYTHLTSEKVYVHWHYAQSDNDITEAMFTTPSVLGTACDRFLGVLKMSTFPYPRRLRTGNVGSRNLVAKLGEDYENGKAHWVQTLGTARGSCGDVATCFWFSSKESTRMKLVSYQVKWSSTEEPPNKGPFGTSHFVQVVLFSKVNELLLWGKVERRACPLLGGCPFLKVNIFSEGS